MDRYVYKLNKNDYMDFIEYEFNRLDNPVQRRKYYMLAMVVVFAVLIVEYLIIPNNPTFFGLSCIFSMALLAGILGMMSKKNRIKALYVKYGFQKVEKENSYPTIDITFFDDKFILKSDKSEKLEEYKYNMIKEFNDMKNIFLLKVEDEKKNCTWQFIAKRCFTDVEKYVYYRDKLSSFNIKASK